MILNIRQIPRIDFASISPAFHGALYNGRVIVANPVVIDGMIVDENYKQFGKCVYHRYTPGKTSSNPLVEVVESLGPYQHYHYFEDMGPSLHPLWSVSEYIGSVPFKNKSWANTIIHAPNTRKGITFTHWSILNFVEGYSESDNNIADDLCLGAFMRLSQKLRDIPTVGIEMQNRSFYWDQGHPSSFPYGWMVNSSNIRWQPWIPRPARQLAISETFEDACGLGQLCHMYKHSNVFTKMTPDEPVMWADLLGINRAKMRPGMFTKNNMVNACMLDALCGASQSPLELFKETKATRGGLTVTHVLKDLLTAVLKFSHGKDHFAVKFTYNSRFDRLEGSKQIQYIETTAHGEFPSKINVGDLKNDPAWVELETSLTTYAKDNWNIQLDAIANVTLIKNFTDLIFIVNSKDGDRYIYGVPMAMAFSTIPTFSFEYDIDARKNDGKLPKNPSEEKK